jgi:hypothetical protein
MNDAEVIAQAQALLYDNIYPYMKTVKEYEDIPKDTLLTFCAWQTEVLEQLLPIAEKRRAVAVEERAIHLSTVHVLIGSVPEESRAPMMEIVKDHLPEHRAIAAKDLDIESSSWRKIGPEERDAIKGALLIYQKFNDDILTFDNDNIKRAIEILRRLISSEEEGI